MPYLFPSDAWAKAFMADINQSEAYREAARNWEGDFYFQVEPGGSLQKAVILYMDLWHGQCRSAWEVNGNQPVKPAYILSAPIGTWKRVINQQLDPIQGIMTGQLKLKGNMAIVMRHVKAAKELVTACTRIPTEFPV